MNRQKKNIKKIAEKDLSNPVQCSEFINHVRGLQENRGFEYEFVKLPVGETGIIIDGKKPNADEKNRYYFIFPFDHNRVKLDTSGKEHVCEGDDYINASFVKTYNGKVYILAQAPLEDYIGEFWQMIWEQDCGQIAMLANLIDGGHVNCNQYWPDAGATEEFGEYVVTHCGEELTQYYIKRKLQVKKGEESKSVTQYQYTCWPDRSVPSTCTSILDLRQEFLANEDSKRGPSILHCSAGVGRTGTFLALDYLVQQAESESRLDVMATVHKLRKSRMNIVQSLSQYIYLHEALLETLFCQPGVSLSVTEYVQSGHQYRHHPDRLDTQYKVLDAMREGDMLSNCTEGRDRDNIHKNRDPHILPRDYAMLALSGTDSQYINGIFVPGFSDPYEQLVTQMPLPHTVTDFWRLVRDFSVSTVVMLNPTLPDVQYWPLEQGATSQIGGQFSFTNVESHSDEHVIVTKLSLSFTTEGVQKIQHIKHFRVKADIVGSCKEHAGALLHLYEAVMTAKTDAEKEMLIHCLNGCEISGIYCCIDHIVKKIESEKKVDVYNAVKAVRGSRPEFITSLEQYQCLYEIAELYLEKKTSYSRS